MRSLSFSLLFSICLGVVSAESQVFIDQTELSGMANAGLYSTGGSWGDFDNDGQLDLYVTNWGTATSDPTNALYHNQGEGSFVDVARSVGVDVLGNSSASIFADYDNDGYLDLYVADFFDQDRLYNNNRDGTFTEVGRARGLIDLDRQGSVVSIAWGDYDNDGFLDVYLGKYYFANDFYANVGDGTFRQINDVGLGDSRDAKDVSWCDYDNDGDLDLYVVNRDQENRLYRNDLSESSSFAEVGAALGVANDEIGQSAAWGDYDSDGYSDLFVANVGANALYHNLSGASFDNVADMAGVRIDEVSWFSADAAWSDLDGDGNLDLFVASGGDRQPQTDLVYLSNGDGSFRNGTTEAAALPPQVVSFRSAAVIGDYDSNGSPDIYATDGMNYPELGNSLFQNQTAGERFIKVIANGKGGDEGGTNSDGIGVRVLLFDDGGSVAGTRKIQSPNGVIFGVEPGRAYRIQVTFPVTGSIVERSDVVGGIDTIRIVEP